MSAQNLKVIALTLGLLVSPSLHGEPFKYSITGTDFDFITDDDPSTFKKLISNGLKERVEMPDKRSNELFEPAFVFESEYVDGTSVEIYVDSLFEKEELARKEAMRYVVRLGKIPTALREGVERLIIHKSEKSITANGGDGLITLYSGNATKRIENHDLEETLFHESVHAAWENTHSAAEGWIKAQKADKGFITQYARQRPEQEDLPETAIFAYAVLHHPDRLPKDVVELIKKTVPNRIKYIEKLIPVGKPLFFNTSRKKTMFEGQALDAISNLLSEQYGKNADDVISWYNQAGKILISIVAQKNGIEPGQFLKEVKAARNTDLSIEPENADAEFGLKNLTQAKRWSKLALEKNHGFSADKASLNIEKTGEFWIEAAAKAFEVDNKELLGKAREWLKKEQQ